MLETHAMRDAGQNGKVAYLMSRFPTLTETFVLYEILAVEEQGLPVEVFPLLRRRQPVVHPEAEAMVRRAHFHPFLSWAILRANWHYLRRRPRAYLGVLAEVLRGTWGKRELLRWHAGDLSQGGPLRLRNDGAARDSRPRPLFQSSDRGGAGDPPPGGNPLQLHRPRP